MQQNSRKTNISGAISRSGLIYYLAPLAALSAYLVYLVASGRLVAPKGYYVLHYLYTYDHGYISRGFVGEVLSWFFDVLTPFEMKVTIIVFSALLVISSSLCIGCALNKTKDDPQRHSTVLFLVLLIFILPISYRSFLIDSKLDKILWALTFFAVLLSERKYGIWLTIPLCILATIINPVFLFCSMILISIILLQRCHDSRYSAKNIAICAISYSSMIALGIWSVVSEKMTGFTDGVEMVNYYFQRYSLPLSPAEAEWFARECIFDFFEPILLSFPKAFQIYGIEWGQFKTTIINLIFLAVPAYVVLSLFWRAVVKAEKNKFQKFIFFLCAISPVVTILPSVMSWESSKYFGNNILVQLCLIIYYLVHDNTSVVDTMKRAAAYCKEHWLSSAVVGVYLSLFIISWSYAKSYT